MVNPIVAGLMPSSERRLEAGTANRVAPAIVKAALIRIPATGLRWLLLVALLAYSGVMDDSAAFAANLYVDQANPQCSDTGQGTQSAPYCTINKGASAAVAGDTVIVASGVYNEKVTVKKSGNWLAPIVFTVADGGNVTVTSETYGFYASSRSWVSINGFNIADTGDDGIYLKNCSNITLSNNHVSRAGLPISGYAAHGIYLNSTVDSFVLNNILDYNTDAGIYVVNGSTRNTIRKNVSTHNARGYVRAAPGIDIRSGSNIIESNICHDNEDSGIQLYTTDPSSNNIINNITYNNGDHGIDISKPGGSTVVGNSVYNNVTAGINLEGSATGSVLANNISVDNGIDSPRTVGNIRVDTDSISGTSLDYNLVYLTRPATMVVWGTAKYSSLAAFAAATGQEVHGMEADPLWLASGSGDFHLLEGSPAIDSANSGVTGAAGTDLEGQPRVDDLSIADTGTGPRTYDDRGAYEFQPPPDTTPPTIALTAPSDKAAVSGMVQVTADARDNVRVAGVQFQLDGNNLGDEVTAAPYAISWNTTSVANGTHSLTAVVRDAAGNTAASAAVGVTVDNILPTVALTAPSDNTTVSGTIAVAATASDNVGVVGVQFQLDGNNLGAEVAAAPFAISWDTAAAANGAHSLTAVARDAAGNTATSAAVGVTVSNADVSPPTVAITNPAPGAVVHGTISVSATAADNVAVLGVQFQLDGNNLGEEATTAPYTLFWNTDMAGDGAHSLTAVARDAAGNTATSTAVDVTVDNTAPTAAITAPSDNTTVFGTISLSADAVDTVGVVGVQFKLDGNNLGAEVASAPYILSWDTTSAANGAHSLTAVARDAAGHSAISTAVDIMVSNADITPPTVAITNPAPDAVVYGAISVSATAADNVAVLGVQFQLDGNNLGEEVTTAPYTLSWNTAAVGDGAHSLTAVARDAAGNTATSTAVGVVVSNPSTITFTPVADTYLNAGSPNKNYGSSDRLWAQSPSYELLMKFAVSGIGTRQVASAKLRLYNVNASDRGGDFYRVGDNNWTETGVTWNNAPAKDATALASLGAVASYTWVEVDVTSFITGDGVFSLRAASASTDSAGYSSKEGSGYMPQLVVNLQ